MVSLEIYIAIYESLRICERKSLLLKDLLPARVRLDHVCYRLQCIDLFFILYMHITTYPQVNIFLLNGNTVMTVQNRDLMFMYDVMKRLKYTGSKIRLNDARYLIHALVDGYVIVAST